MSKPNVVLFVTDGHRTDALGCYGNPLLQTPNIDALAAGGALMRRAFCSHSVCMPTRASLITGRYPHVHGVWANGCRLSEDEVTLPQVMSENGYATCAAGKVHLEPQQVHAGGVAPRIEGSYYGFDEVHLCENNLGEEYLQFIDEQYPELSERARKRDSMPEEAHDLQWSTDQAISFIERQAQADTPFLCQCSFHELIPPSTPPPVFAGIYDPTDMTVPRLCEDDLAKKPPFYRQCYEGYVANGMQPDEPTLREHIAGMYDQASFIDKQLGRLVNALKRARVYDNTIVLFTADHGLSLNDHWQWRHGPFLFDEVINVPMIWRVPGCDGSETAALVEQVDIMPTLLDMCGMAIPPGVQGRSIAPLARGESDTSGRDSVLVQERHAPDLIVRGLDVELIWQVGLRTDEWKLIHYDSYPHGELYDLKNDPGEFNNLWADPAWLGQRREMEALLMERLVAAQDPLPVRECSW